MQKLLLPAAAALLALAIPSSVSAELPVGTKAPQFRTSIALAGKAMRFSLATALRRGPVVLYFYPKAFTQGCTMEAHAFAEASEDFGAYGATVVGLSADDLPTLQRFSTEACRDKFAVGVASPQIIKAYDVALKRAGSSMNMTDRTSYVIAQDGRITMVHSEMDYRDHVKLTLAAVKKLSAKP
jgi:Peroxiredoxin